MSTNYIIPAYIHYDIPNASFSVSYNYTDPYLGYQTGNLAGSGMLTIELSSNKADTSTFYLSCNGLCTNPSFPSNGWSPYWGFGPGSGFGPHNYATAHVGVDESNPLNPVLTWVTTPATNPLDLSKSTNNENWLIVIILIFIIILAIVFTLVNKNT